MAGGDHHQGHDDEGDRQPARQALVPASGLPPGPHAGNAAGGLGGGGRHGRRGLWPTVFGGDPQPPENRAQNEQIEEVRERLGREVVLADPVGDEEDRRSQPDDAAVAGQRREHEEQCPQQHDVVEHRSPRRQLDQVVEPSQLVEQRTEAEERRPVVVDVEVLDGGRSGYATVGDDVVHDPDVLPRPRVAQRSVDDRRGGVQEGDQGEHMRTEQGRRGRPAERQRREARGQHEQGREVGGRQDGNQADVGHRPWIDAVERDQPEDHRDRDPEDRGRRLEAGQAGRVRGLEAGDADLADRGAHACGCLPDQPVPAPCRRALVESTRFARRPVVLKRGRFHASIEVYESPRTPLPLPGR